MLAAERRERGRSRAAGVDGSRCRGAGAALRVLEEIELDVRLIDAEEQR